MRVSSSAVFTLLLNATRSFTELSHDVGPKRVRATGVAERPIGRLDHCARGRWSAGGIRPGHSVRLARYPACVDHAGDVERALPGNMLPLCIASAGVERGYRQAAGIKGWGVPGQAHRDGASTRPFGWSLRHYRRRCVPSCTGGAAKWHRPRRRNCFGSAGAQCPVTQALIVSRALRSRAFRRLRRHCREPCPLAELFHGSRPRQRLGQRQTGPARNRHIHWQLGAG